MIATLVSSSTAARTIRAAAAAVLLTAALNLQVNVYTLNWSIAPRIPVELVAAVLVILAARSVGSVRDWPVRLASIGLAVLVVIYLLDDLGRAVYGRAPDLVFDTAQLPHIFDLLASSMSLWLLVPLVAGAVAALLVLAWVAYGLSRMVAGAVGSIPMKPARMGGVAGAALLLVAAGDLTRPYPETPAAFSANAVDAGSHHLRTAHLWLNDGAPIVSEIRRNRGDIRDGRTTLPGLAAVNVYVIWVESYGASLYGREEHREAFETLYAEYAAPLAEKGFAVRSALMTSSTYGGVSWLAHLSLSSGAWIGDNLTYRAYLRSDLDTLTTILKRTGHATALFMPGIKRYWPEGASLRFDRWYVAKDFDYRGVEFGYFGIPDQVTMERVATMRPPAPRFVQVALISSHYPFHPLPPYLEDYAAIDDPEAWRQAASEAGSFVEPDWSDVVDGYLESTIYSTRTALDFVVRHVEEDSLVVILGDHQPWRVVSGGLGGHDVPAHILSNNRHVLACFDQDGYTPGLMPESSEAIYGMDRFLHQLLAHFGPDAEPCIESGLALRGVLPSQPAARPQHHD